MQFKKNQDRLTEHLGVRPTVKLWKRCGYRLFACLAAAAALTGAAEPRQQAPDPGRATIYRPIDNAGPVPDANDQMQMRDQQAKQKNYEAANAERKKQIADDSAKLLKLATDLKTEVDKTSKDTLSLNVIRKADEIEKLAHSVKEKMKLTVGGS